MLYGLILLGLALLFILLVAVVAPFSKAVQTKYSLTAGQADTLFVTLLLTIFVLIGFTIGTFLDCHSFWRCR
jgi:hypothetical protein